MRRLAFEASEHARLSVLDLVLRAPARLRLAVATAALALPAVGCHDGATSPGSPRAGAYRAAPRRVTSLAGQGTLDLLAAGATMSLVIARSDSVSGALYVTAQVTGDTAVVHNLAGRAVRTGNTVRFDQLTDSVVELFTFAVDGTALRADQVLGDNHWQVVLARQ